MHISRNTLSKVCRHRWRSYLSAILGILLALDQRRRSRCAALRFELLYQEWFARAASQDFLRELHAKVKAMLEECDPKQLRQSLKSSSVDLAIAGGGFKSLYALGAYFALQHAGLRVERTSGASAGAYLAVLLAGSRYQLEDLLQENLLGWCDCCVQAVRECKTIFLGSVWSYMSAELTKRLCGWLPAANTLFLSVTTVSRHGLTEHVTTSFKSPSDLEATVNASMAIPVILCNGLAFPWRGHCALDGGFANNCPVYAFRNNKFKSTEVNEPESPEALRNGTIIKVDGNHIAGMPMWRKLLHVAYAPSDVCKDMLLEGVRDMLEILRTGKEELNGITLIKPNCSMEKRDFSYQLFPGREHVRRLLKGRTKQMG